MSHKELDIVVLVRDVPEHALRHGDAGTIVHVYGADTCEVEFVRASGATAAVANVLLLGGIVFLPVLGLWILRRSEWPPRKIWTLA